MRRNLPSFVAGLILGVFIIATTQKQTVLEWSIIAIVITTILFWIENSINTLDRKTVQNLFHINEFTAAQNTMAELKFNNLKVSLAMLKTSFIAYYAYIHDGQGPSKEEINQIKSEQDYLNIINSGITNPNFKDFLEKPGKEKINLEVWQIILFIGLIFTQIMIAWISTRA